MAAIMTGHVHIKRIYDPPARADGQRVLVDRLWPRGIRKDDAALTEWFRDIAPSPPLRKWFGHLPERYDAFRERYREELAANDAAVHHMRELMRKGDVSLLYAAHDRHYNHARILAEYLEEDRPS